MFVLFKLSSRQLLFALDKASLQYLCCHPYILCCSLVLVSERRDEFYKIQFEILQYINNPFRFKLISSSVCLVRITIPSVFLFRFKLFLTNRV